MEILGIFRNVLVFFANVSDWLVGVANTSSHVINNGKGQHSARCQQNLN